MNKKRNPYGWLYFASVAHYRRNEVADGPTVKWEEPTNASQTTSTSSLSTESSIPEQSTEEETTIDKRIDQMSLEEKSRATIFVRVPEINQVEDIQTYHLGGYVLFGRDTENETAETLKQKIADYQQASSIPLLIGMDEEGGTVTRISRNPALVQTPFLSLSNFTNKGLASN